MISNLLWDARNWVSEFQMTERDQWTIHGVFSPKAEEGGYPGRLLLSAGSQH